MSKHVWFMWEPNKRTGSNDYTCALIYRRSTFFALPSTSSAYQQNQKPAIRSATLQMLLRIRLTTLQDPDDAVYWYDHRLGNCIRPRCDSESALRGPQLQEKPL